LFDDVLLTQRIGQLGRRKAVSTENGQESFYRHGGFVFLEWLVFGSCVVKLNDCIILQPILEQSEKLLPSAREIRSERCTG